MILGLETLDLILLIAISLLICVTVCTLAMEAGVLFVPAFVFLFPVIMRDFPSVTPNEAIGLAITIEFFGYTSSVLGYYFRGQVDLRLAGRLLIITVPFAIVGRALAFVMPEDFLLVIFAMVLLFLAYIIFREYQGEFRKTCLLCGDSLTAMKYEAQSAEKGAAGNPADARAAARRALELEKEQARAIRFNATDRGILGLGGIFAGVIAVAIGEITNTFLQVRKNMSPKVATGTAAMVLHITILAALGANLVIIFGDVPYLEGDQIEIPWLIAFILAPVVVIGGQIGSFINSRLSDRMLVRALTTAYTVVGLFVLVNVAWQMAGG